MSLILVFRSLDLRFSFQYFMSKCPMPLCGEVAGNHIQILTKNARMRHRLSSSRKIHLMRSNPGLPVLRGLAVLDYDQLSRSIVSRCNTKHCSAGDLWSYSTWIILCTSSQLGVRYQSTLFFHNAIARIPVNSQKASKSSYR